MTKVGVDTSLSMDDWRWDLIIPHHIAILRCNDHNSFCGNKHGVVEGRCENKTTVKKEIPLANEAGGYETVEFDEHLECHCVPL